MNELDAIVRQWINFRKTWQEKKTQPGPGDIAEFVRGVTALSERFATAIGSHNPEYLEAIGEIAMHIAAHVRNPGLMSE